MNLCSSHETAENRLGVSCSKKVGNSVTRNLITRRYREAFRAWNRENGAKSETTGFYDVVVSVHPKAASAKFGELNASLYRMLNGLLEQLTKKKNNYV
jgi:ribonuclease P protein component